MKIEKHDLLTLIITFGILLGFVIGLPFFLNIEKLMGVGVYNYDDQKELQFDNANVKLKSFMKVEYLEQMRAGDVPQGNYFMISIALNLDSTGEVQNLELDFVNYSIYLNSIRTIFTSETINLNDTQSFSNTIVRQLNKEDRVIFTGFVRFSFNLGGEEYEREQNFNIIHTQPVDAGYYLYSVDMPLIWLTGLYFILFGVSFVAFARVIWNIRFKMRYTEEQRKKDEYYHGYIRKLAEEKNAENST